MTSPKPPPFDRRDSFDVKPGDLKRDEEITVTVRNPGHFVPRWRVILTNGRPAKEPGEW